MPTDDDDATPDVRVVEDDAAQGSDSARDSTDARREEHFRRDDRDRPRQVDSEVRRDKSRRIEDDGDDALGPRVQKRINQFRRRAGDAEARAQSLADENRRLVTQLQEVSGAALTHYEAAAVARLESAEREAREAYESGDGQKVVEANRKLASAQFAKDTVEQAKARKPEPQRAAAEPQRTRYSERTQDWIDDNPWFETDEKAKRVAVNIHDVMLDEGYTPDTDKYFRELTKRCRNSLPKLFDEEDGDEEEEDPPPRRRAAVEEEERPRRAAPVSGVNRTAAARPRNVTEVKLSKDQLEAAAIAGVTPKAYALQLLRKKA